MAVSAIGTGYRITARWLDGSGHANRYRFLTVAQMGGAANDIFEKQLLNLRFNGSHFDHLLKHMQTRGRVEPCCGLCR